MIERGAAKRGETLERMSKALGKSPAYLPAMHQPRDADQVARGPAAKADEVAHGR